MTMNKDFEARLKALEDWQQAIARTCIAAPQPQPKPTPTLPTVYGATTAQPNNNLIENFRPDLREHLTTKDGKVYLNAFIGNESWAVLNEDAKAIGMHWVKAGKDSRWER